MAKAIFSNLRILLIGLAFGITAVGSAAANGALAIDQNQGSAYGLGRDYPTMREAEQRALSECGRGCRIVVRFRRGCAAYSADQTRGSTIFGWAPGSTRDVARAKADANCLNYGGKRCLIRVWGCNSQ
jgi:hypothetical protein